jgi:hypothetical protein
VPVKIAALLVHEHNIFPIPETDYRAD